MNYAYHEVKTFLATQEFDSARHYEVFRTRALANNGAMGLEGVGKMNRRMLESRAGWPETSLYLYVMRGTLTQLLYRYGELYAHNPAEKLMFRLSLQDKARHLAYGMAHIKYTVEHKGPDFATGLLRVTGTVERDMAAEMDDPVLWEALAIIFGGSIDNIQQGMKVVHSLQQRYIREYLKRSQYCGIDKTEDNLGLELAKYLRLEEPSEA